MGGDRRMEVLRAIVEDYVSSREPVGSRALAERHRIGVSPATIRNDMAFLEESGYITQPHTSAGRIPTDKGYRLFVDRLATIKPLSTGERAAIERFLADAVDLDDVLERTARLLAQVTRQVAIIQYPSLRRSSLLHLELIPLGAHSLLAVVITDSGRVEQRTIDVGAQPKRLTELRACLNDRLVGRRLSELAGPLDELAAQSDEETRPLVEAIGRQLVEALQRDTEDRIVLAGTANLARANVDFPRSIGPVLDALEEQVVMLRLITEMAQGEAVAVSIGEENRHEGLSEVSLVSTSYGTESQRSPAGALAVLGPTRMDYPGTMAAVRAVARYVSQILNSQ